MPGSQRATLSQANSNNSFGASVGGGGVVKVKAEDPTFVFTPVSPRSAPGSSSNAPDFFVASTRSTADVKSSYSSYCRVLDPCQDAKTTGSSSSLLHAAEFHHVKSDFGTTTTASSVSSTGLGTSSSSQVKIFAQMSPKRDGSSSTRIISSRSIRDSLPKELIDKIKAASQGRKTIAIIEPITRSSPSRQDACSSSSLMDSVLGSNRVGGLGSRFSVAAANLNRWRSVGVVPPLSNSNNNISDHDYCCPSRPGGRYR